jgi:hypothetical protein
MSTLNDKYHDLGHRLRIHDKRQRPASNDGAKPRDDKDKPTRFWKIRHKPTGLFYKPSKFDSKENLSKVGKTYSRKPSINSLCGIRVKNPDYDWQKYGSKQFFRVPMSELEVVEFEVIEVKGGGHV